MSAKDMLGRDITAGDYVVSYNHVFHVIGVGRNAYIRVELIEPSKTSRPKNVYSGFTCLVDKSAVENYLNSKKETNG